jgi:LacI family transcriptional regulator
MLDYLYSQGHRNIALIQDIFEENRFDLMKEFNRFHLEHGIIPKQEQIIYYSEKETPSIIEKMKNNKITAVFSCFDYNTLRLIRGLTKAGLRVPEYVSIASFDGIQQMEDMGITTLKQDVRRLIEEAFKIILSESYNNTKVKKIPAEIIIRNSVCNITAEPQLRGK